MASRSRPLLAIDPGLNSMGWAFWSENRVAHIARTNEDRPPSQVGLIKAPRKFELVPRALWIAKELERATMVLGTMGGPIGVQSLDIVSEYPAWHGDQVRLGWAAGDMQKVVLLVGVLAGYLSQAHSFTPVTPAEWKGQLPKDVVIRRLIKRFGVGATRDYEKDMWDAIGIGLWKMGRF
jgi:hypothetical protein